MKVVQQYVLGGAGVLEVGETEIPTISSGEVLIKGLYTSVNYADIKTRTGNKGGGSKFPFTLGLDMVGFIIESNSPNFKKGDYVISFPKNGSYKQYAVASEKLTFHIPQTINAVQAAAMPTVSILSYILLNQIGEVKKSDTIVVHSAAGGVGSILVRLAKLQGVSRVIGTVGNIQKKEYVLQNGADEVFTYDTFSEGVLNITNGKGAHVVYDSVAGDVTKRSLKCLANFGTLVQFGNSSGSPGDISTNDVHNSCRNVKGFSLGTTRKEDPLRIAPVVEQLIPLIETGKLEIPIAKTFSLDEIQDAHRYMESREHHGKILIDLA